MPQLIIEGEDAKEIAKDIERAIKERIEKLVRKGERVIIGVAGPSSAGKSTIAEHLLSRLSQKYKCKGINADMFYKDNSYLLKKIYGTYDHPMLIDFEEMRKVVKNIKEGKQEVEIPIYIFETARRNGKRKESIRGIEVFLIDNLYLIEELGNLLDISIYVRSHSKAEEIIRRLIRDKEERLNLDYETSLDLIASAFLMYDVFGSRQERKADIVVINKHSLFHKRATSYHEIKIYDTYKIKRLKQFLSKKGVKKIKKEIWDYYYKNKRGREIMRIREIIKENKPTELEISYKIYPFPFHIKNNKTTSEEMHNSIVFSFRTSREGMFVLAHTLATIAGFEFIEVEKNIKRERYEVEEDIGIIIDKSEDIERAEIFGDKEKINNLLAKINDLF